MSNPDYWQERAEKRIHRAHKNSDKTIKEITAAYQQAIDDINNGTFKGRAEDDRYYWINAENNGLGIADINDPKGWLTDDDKQVIADTWSKLQSGEIKDYLPEDIQ